MLILLAGQISNVIEKIKQKMTAADYEALHNALLSATQTILELTSFKNIMDASSAGSPLKKKSAEASSHSPALLPSMVPQLLDEYARDMVSKETQANLRPPSPVVLRPSLDEIPELLVLQEHQEKLTRHIETLDDQLAFLKAKRREDQEKSAHTVEQLVRQLSQLNALLSRARDERERAIQEAAEKGRGLETSLVHLTAAQEEIRRLLAEKTRRDSSASLDSQRMCVTLTLPRPPY